MVFANNFTGKSDSEILNNAICGKDADGIVVITPRQIDKTRDYWLLDSAVLLPENTTVVLQNVKLKLSDRCRDNFFRTANCGLGIKDPAPLCNVHIRGEGFCLLEGADRPRATGDSGKLLRDPCPHFPDDLCKMPWIPQERQTPKAITFSDVHDHSYGTDAGRPGESQYGDWRGIGILFANTNGFSISGISIKEPHGWAISMEACTNGRVEKIHFDARMHKMIDDIYMNIENQDGIDVRNGCHHIVISDITGCTGDDVIALTAIASDTAYKAGGSLKETHVMPNDWSKRDKDIHDVIIRNVIAHSYFCYTVRLLPAMASVYNVVIDGVIDTSEAPKEHGGTILLGESSHYGENRPNDMRNVTVSNVICNSKRAVYVKGFLNDAVISNIVNQNPACETVTVVRENGLRNVTVSNAITVQQK